MKPARNRKWAIVAAALCLGFTGCKDKPTLAPVSGRVLMDGKPLPFGYVVFYPDQGQPSQGEIGEGGAFSMSSFTPGDGAIIGDHQATVLCYQGHDPKVRSKQIDGHGALGNTLIPLAYTRSGMSGLTVTIPPEGLSDYTIELSSKGPGR